MRPRIDETWFGSITVEGTRYEHDIIIRLSGKVCKRNKQLSKAVYGTSHIISQAEAMQVYQEGAELLIIGAGQYGMVSLSDEAAGYLQQQQCRVVLSPMKEAIQAWNEAEGAVIGLFHVTC